MRVAAVVLALAVATLVSRTGSSVAAQGGTIVRGRAVIEMPVPARRPSSAYPSRAVTPATLAPSSEVRHVVVFLRNATPQAVSPARREIQQRNEQFIPRVVAVPVGSEVSFPNDDPFYHNVFSLSRTRSFNLGRYPKGQTRTVRFDKPGIVKVFCDIHSHMTATVMVFDHPWFAVPDENGNFELAGVPAGTREITAWHERLGDTTIPVQVESGRVTPVAFVLPVPAR
jgi:plastocyanin